MADEPVDPDMERRLQCLAKGRQTFLENTRLRREGKLPSLKHQRHVKELEKKRKDAEKKAAGRVSPLTLFKRRMEREGKHGTILSRRKEIAAANPELSTSQITLQVRQEFGYAGKQEQELHRQWLESLSISRRDKVQQATVKRHRMAKKLNEFDQAMTALPPTAAIETEYDWIQSHPAMGRKLLMADGDTSKVEITPDDISGAPSRSAVYKLMDYANRPQKFNDMLVSEHKKRASGTGAEAAEGAVATEDMSRLKRIHDQFMAMQRGGK